MSNTLAIIANFSFFATSIRLYVYSQSCCTSAYHQNRSFTLEYPYSVCSCIDNLHTCIKRNTKSQTENCNDTLISQNRDYGVILYKPSMLSAGRSWSPRPTGYPRTSWENWTTGKTCKHSSQACARFYLN